MGPLRLYNGIRCSCYKFNLCSVIIKEKSIIFQEVLFMAKRGLFVINPHSGKCQIRNKLIDIIDIFVSSGIDVNIYTTQERKDAVKIIKQKGDKFDVVILSGGDGTLSESVKAVMTIPEYKRPVIGYIPAGTTNDFATTLNIPKNMIKAAKNIAAGKVFKCDVGKFNSDYFIYIAAFGAFTDVSYGTPQQMKNYFGHFAYVMEGIKRVSSLSSYHIKMEYEGNAIEGDFIYGMIANTKSVAGIKNLVMENVKLDDGLFEIVLIKMPQTPFELQNILAGIVTNDLTNDMFLCFRAPYVKITADNEMPWTLDGEFGGDYKDVYIENKKQAVGILVEAKAAEKAAKK